MLLLAGLFIGVFFLEGPASQLVELAEDAQAGSEPMDPTQRAFWKFYIAYVIILLLVLLALIGVAGFELYAIRRFGLQNYKRIQSERRAMIAREVARLRSRRNGVHLVRIVARLRIVAADLQVCRGQIPADLEVRRHT